MSDAAADTKNQFGYDLATVYLALAGGTLTGDVTCAAGVDFVLDTATGTKFGTGATQKLAFYGATPIVRQAAIVDTSSGVVATVEAEVNKLKAVFRNLGLIA
jgi:hypothetical protein